MARPLGEKHNPELRRLYEVDGLTLRQIAKRFGVTHQAVHDRLLRMGVAMRPPSIRQLSLDHDLLYQLYIVDGLTLAGVAGRLYVTMYVVRRELIRHQIPRRRTSSRPVD